MPGQQNKDKKKRKPSKSPQTLQQFVSKMAKPNDKKQCSKDNNVDKFSLDESEESTPTWAKSLHTKIDSLSSDFSDFKVQLSEAHSDINKLKDKQCESETRLSNLEDNFNLLKTENEQLKRQMSIIMGRVIQSENKSSLHHESILDLQCRSMRDNSVFTEIPNDHKNETNAEVIEKVYNFIENKAGISDAKSKVKIIRAHRMGVKTQDKPRPVVVKFFTSNDKQVVMNEKKSNNKLSVYDQYPDEIRERRRNLGPIMQKAREDGQRAVLTQGKLFVDGIRRYGNYPVLPEIGECFTGTYDITQCNIRSGTSITAKGNTFQGHCANIASPKEARDLIDILHSDSYIATAKHTSYAYRLRNDSGKILQNYCDDDEYGAGSKLLELLTIPGKEINNAMVVVTRWPSDQKLGNRRFQLIVEAAKESLRLLSQGT